MAHTEILSRGVENVLVRESLEKKLASGKRLRVKFGIDPTSPDIHFGHAVALRKLREFQDAGHTAVLIIGDFTAQIGDPSGRNKERPPLSEREIKANMKRYLEDAGKIVNVKKAEIHKNSEWHRKMGFAELARIMADFTAQQIIEREDFKARLKEQRPLWMHELLYPALQAYDSVAVKADLEIGGTDQTFNLLAGRHLMEKRGLVPQDILTTPLLEGTDGVKKMSKSAGNYIALGDSPTDIFGKTMSVPDSLVAKYFLLLTDKGAPSEDPYQAKLALAETLVRIAYGEAKAKRAREEFKQTFSQQGVPTDMPELKLPKKAKLTEALLISGIASKSEARRLIEQNAVQLNQETMPSDEEIIFSSGDILKVGKKKFFKVKI